MIGSKCPTDEELLLSIDGEPTATDVRSHLTTCAECRQRIERLHEEIDYLRRIAPKLPWAANRKGSTDTRVLCWPTNSTSQIELPSPGGGVQAPAELPARIGKYIVIAPLGHGGQADVFRAVHPELQTEVVVKLSRCRDRLSAPERERLVSEGRLLAELDHPSLAQIHDLDVHEGRPFLVVEYLKGPNLAQHVADGRLAPREFRRVAELVAQMAGAVAAIHARGVLHLDIKPQNVIIDEHGTPHLVDFGLARWRHAWNADSPDDQSLGGTPAYMSPEQARGDRDGIGACSDVFSLGAVLHELLTGVPPYGGASTQATLQLAAEGRRDMSLLQNAHVPRRLRVICERALATDIGQRYASADAFARELRRFAHRPRLQMIIAAAAIVLTCAVGGWFGWRDRLSTVPAPRHAAADIVIYRGDQLSDLRTAAPLVTGDLLRFEYPLGGFRHAAAFWFDSEGKFHHLVTTSASEQTTLRYPAEGQATPITGPPGTEFILICASRAGPVDVQRVMSSFPIGAPWPRLPGHALATLEPAGVSVQGLRAPGAPQEDPIYQVKTRLEQLRRDLNGQSYDFFGVAFAHQDRSVAIDARPPPADVNRSNEIDPQRRQEVAEATSLLEQAALLDEQGDYQGALQAAEQAVQRFTSLYGGEHPETLNALHALAVAQHRIGDFVAAKANYEKLITLRKKVLGINDPAMAESLINYGACHLAQSDFAKARKCLGQAITILRQVHGDRHASIAAALNNLGMVSIQQGDWVAARSYLERALAMNREIHGDDHPDTLSMLNNLGILAYNEHDYATSRQYLEQALSAEKRIRPAGHPAIATSLQNLSAALRSQGDLTGARACLEEAIDMRRKQLGEEHPQTIISIANLASLLRAQGEFDLAQEYLEQVLAIEKKSADWQDNQHVAMTLNNLATLRQAQGAFDASEPLLRESLAIRQRILGPEHPETADSLSNLGALFMGRHDYEAAAPYLEQALAARLKIAKTLLGSLSEAEGFAYVARAQSGLDPLLTTAHHLPGSASDHVYSAVWETQALLTRALVERRSVQVGQTEQFVQVRRQLNAVRSELAKTVLAPAASDKIDLRAQRIEQLTKQKERFERELGALSAVVRRDQQTVRARYEDLAGRLPPDAAVVDLLQWQAREVPAQGEVRPEARYDAFVFRRTDRGQAARVDWISLGPAEPIDQAVHGWREQLTNESTSGREEYDRTLRRLVWEPIEARLDGCSKILIIPDGALTGVPWVALPGRNPASFLIEEYTISTTSYGQQLCVLTDHKLAAADQFLVIGGVQYDSVQRPPVEQLVAAHRGPIHGSSSRPNWPPLPGTLREAREITELAPNPSEVVHLDGDTASEAGLREYLPKARFAHLATHGFFVDDSVLSVLDGQHTANTRGAIHNAPGSIERNPLLLSGVVLAGANQQQPTDDLGVPLGDDGILTAEEVVDLDLSGTELVVLSACDTGRGTLARGEGVVGLQRAFHLAGARSVIASLWKVDDEATSQLMTAFYENLWRRGMNKAEALRQAQLDVLHLGVGEVKRGDPAPTEGTSRGPGTPQPVPAVTEVARAHPRHWAAWVLSGAPGTLTTIAPP